MLNFQQLSSLLHYLVMTKISEVLDQYTGICKEAMMTSAAKLSKSFEKVIVEVLLLYMVIPGRINYRVDNIGDLVPPVAVFWYR